MSGFLAINQAVYQFLLVVQREDKSVIGIRIGGSEKIKVQELTKRRKMTLSHPLREEIKKILANEQTQQRKVA